VGVRRRRAAGAPSAPAGLMGAPCAASSMIAFFMLCTNHDSSAHGAATGAHARQVHPRMVSAVMHQCQVPAVSAVISSLGPAGAKHQAPPGIWHDAQNRLGRHPGLGGGRALLALPGRVGRWLLPAPGGPALCAPARECAPSCACSASDRASAACGLHRCWEVHAPGEAEAGKSPRLPEAGCLQRVCVGSKGLQCRISLGCGPVAEAQQADSCEGKCERSACTVANFVMYLTPHRQTFAPSTSSGRCLDLEPSQLSAHAMLTACATL
jgi:hypothetical protein